MIETHQKIHVQSSSIKFPHERRIFLLNWKKIDIANRPEWNHAGRLGWANRIMYSRRAKELVSSKVVVECGSLAEMLGHT